MSKVLIFALALSLVAGCSTVDPSTGQRVHDPVKTAQVRAAVKPLVSAGVLAVVTKNPEAAQYFDQAASAICEMRDTQQVTELMFRARILGIIDQHAEGVDPLIRLGFMTVIAIFEINYADRLRADLPPDQFTWNLMDVLCDGVRGGLGAPPEAFTPENRVVLSDDTRISGVRVERGSGVWSKPVSSLGW